MLKGTQQRKKQDTGAVTLAAVIPLFLPGDPLRVGICGARPFFSGINKCYERRHLPQFERRCGNCFMIS